MVSGSCFVYGSCVALMLVRCVISSICDLGFWRVSRRDQKLRDLFGE